MRTGGTHGHGCLDPRVSEGLFSYYRPTKDFAGNGQGGIGAKGVPAHANPFHVNAILQHRIFPVQSLHLINREADVLGPVHRVGEVGCGLPHGAHFENAVLPYRRIAANVLDVH